MMPTGHDPFPRMGEQGTEYYGNKRGYSRLRVMMGVTPHHLYWEKYPDYEMYLMQEQD